MKKVFCVVALSIMSCLPVCVSAATTPEVLTSGFTAYKESGAKSALEAWIKGSGIEGSKEAMAQANMLVQISEYYGKYLGYELVKHNAIGKNTNVYLIVMNYEKGSVFAKFFTYLTPSGKEVSQTFNFNTNADLVWPSAEIYGS